MEILDGQLTIGTDPEFYFINSHGNYIRANDIIRSNIRVSDAGIYGLDGCPSTAELRPSPSADPKVVTENVRKLLKKLYSDIPESRRLKWLAGNGSERNPTGGHLHSSYPSRRQLENSSNILMKTICNYLGVYVAMPLILGTDFEKYRQRVDNGYGSLSFRENSRLWSFAEAHAGWEYRAVPSHIISPALTLSTLSLFKVVLLECLNFNGKIQRTLPYNFSEHRGLTSKTDITKHYQSIKDEIQAMYYYPKYHNAISYLFNVVENKQQGNNENRDMKITWGLADARQEEPRITRKQWLQQDLFALVESGQ